MKKIDEKIDKYLNEARLGSLTAKYWFGSITLYFEGTEDIDDVEASKLLAQYSKKLKKMNFKGAKIVETNSRVD